MLREWLTALRISVANTAVGQLGYVAELASLSAKHRRCKSAWLPHMQKSREALLAAAEQHRDASRPALVLGGGALADIPLGELTELFGQVNLVDIAFLAKTRRTAARFRRRVTLIHADLTGISERLNDEQGIPAVSPGLHGVPAEIVADAAWVASVNCLTQLPLLPSRHLLDRGFPENAVETFAISLMQAHLEALVALPCPWCLISEWQDVRFDRAGAAVGQTDYADIIEPLLRQASVRRCAEWEWWVHPPGELPAGESEVRRIAVWRSC